MKPMLIGLGHKARQGKDEIAGLLAKHYGFRVYHFADALKDECAKYFNWTFQNKNILARTAFEEFRNSAEEPGMFGNIILDSNPRIEITPSKAVLFGEFSLLQFWGGFRRAQDKDYWVKAAFRQIDFTQNAVIADMRHRNEAEWIEILGGMTVRIRRMVQSDVQYIDPDRDPNHLSEIELNNYRFDYSFDILNNPDTMTTSQMQVCERIHDAYLHMLRNGAGRGNT